MKKKPEPKRSVGKPRIQETPETMKAAIDAYFQSCDESGEPYTVTGLAMALGFCSRVSLYDYEKKPEYSTLIKSARLKIENAYEKYLTTLDKPTGVIFWLKNHNWVDKQEVKQENTGEQTIKIIREVIHENPKD
jgi:hypothetical protein